METINDFTPNEGDKRPQFLTVLCVLSYIWTGIVLLLLILLLCFSGPLFDMLENLANGEGVQKMDQRQMEGITKLLEMGSGVFAMMMGGIIITYIISLIGVIKMWKMQKWGFYIYAGINGAEAIYYIISGSYFGAIINIIFIALYAMNLKYLNPRKEIVS